MNPGGRPRTQPSIDFDVGIGDEEPTVVTADRGVYFSAGGRRREELLNVAHKKRRLLPSQLDDPLAQWLPVPEDSVEVENDLEELAPLPSAGNKRKRYDSLVGSILYIGSESDWKLIL